MNFDDVKNLLGFLPGPADFRAVNSDLESVTKHIRESICAFQLDYTVHQFSMSQKHKCFKENHTKDLKSTETKLAYENLNSLAENGAKKLFGDQIERIKKYFFLSHLNNVPPRVGVHQVDVDDAVKDVIMTSGKRTSKKIDDYTCFSEILRSGVPYLNNNLPLTVQKSVGFKHHGLNITELKREYKLRFRDGKWCSIYLNNTNRNGNDADWNRINSSKDEDGSSYKSHLIIPVTFRKHADLGRFPDGITGILRLPDNGRSILGFVCIDHPATYYFYDSEPRDLTNIDINVMYVYADMISHILITNRMYTDGSDTYRQYHDTIAQEGDNYEK